MLAIILLAFVASVSATQCPTVTPVKDFKFASFAKGTWYQVARYPNVFENRGECGTIEYTIKHNVTDVTNHYVIKHQGFTVHGTAKPANNADNTGIVIHSFPYGAHGEFKNYESYILAIDYTEYCISYYCTYDDKTKEHHTFGWIYSRHKVLSVQAKKDVDKFLNESNVLEADKFLWPKFTAEACRVEN